jgi:DNA invertase Pin-like site-specific DNA recombinase
MVWQPDRICRSLGRVVELVAGLQTEGIGLKVLTGCIDTNNSTGRLSWYRVRHLLIAAETRDRASEVTILDVDRLV